MNVLSLFDGMSCGQIALKELGIIPDWYKWKCSDTQIYRMLGNGWTIKVIKHILSFIDFN